MLYIKLLNSFDQLIVIFKSTVNIIQKRNCIAVKLTLTNIKKEIRVCGKHSSPFLFDRQNRPKAEFWEF